MRYQKGTFVTVPNIDSLDILPAAAQALFMWLCKYADDEGICFPSRKKLAGHLGTTMPTIDKHLLFLEETGFITKTLRKKKGSNENMSNLYQIELVDYPSKENRTTPSKEILPVTKPSINSIQLTTIAEDKLPPEKPFNFEEELSILQDSSWKPNKIISLYWSKKGWRFDNRSQFKTALSRELRPAKSLIGYSGSELSSAMDFCQNNYDMWSLETVVKRITDLVNKK